MKERSERKNYSIFRIRTAYGKLLIFFVSLLTFRSREYVSLAENFSQLITFNCTLNGLQRTLFILSSVHQYFTRAAGLCSHSF
jgi:hypothetical protein